ncbi:uncharacterized protein SPSK_05239 [Sporothrix schenckii 1099-18]|uniref:Coiled-coil domain-containing protein 16 n=2 Tax=Sporothrix schenckii TaxID=29908 RepID=U7Q6U9_SPOS1|nr:uncharacterized protein SPSK_05239 [Sporothrix schenckii 1099-18]ERT02436.1 hypothetical protein HMPREF1624_00734 [Sporothrix schenckii ATCC 58251]KJR80294.1 hypothetical protein SPSK_05239 [Sporothrix schenckii 1099-18]
MADVRALLRQQRTARRIDHPLAVYSDSGKLSCAVCREPVRPESAWDDHLRSAQHRQKVRAVQALQSNTVNDGPEATAPAAANAANGHSDAAPILAHKRRYSETEDDGDVDMGSDGDGGSVGNEDEPSRKKQHRAELPPGVKPTVEKPTIEIKSPIEGREAESGRAHGHEPPRKLSLSTTPQLTPPLARRSSGTPAQGVEMRIPSRPATPIAIKDSFLGGGSGVSNNNNGNTSGSNSGSNSGGLPSAASTPKMAPLGRSPLIPQEAQMAAQSASGPLNDAVNGSNGTTAARPKTTTKATTTTIVEEDEAAPGIAQADIDEDEWAAFEAEVVNAPEPRPALPTTATGGTGTRPDMNGGLVASAPVVSAQDLTAVEGDDDERSKRREAEEAQRMAEKEEATRAREDEFEDMQELESRVQKLKEKREALRSQASQQQLRTTKSTTLAPPAVLSGEATRRLSATMVDKEDIRQQLAATHAKSEPAVDEDDVDEDEDEDEADWDAFRFRS